MAFTIFKNISELVTLQGAAAKSGRRIQEADLGLQKKQAIVVEKGVIVWLGPQSRLPKKYVHKKNKEFDFKNQTLLPGWVECHTHTVFAGSRAHEFELRNQGVSYQEIAAKGGGILSTMKQTRQKSLPALCEISQQRVNKFLQQGVTTLELKSGYCLDAKGEIKLLEVSQRLKGPRLIHTFLGAHDLPPEFRDKANPHETYLKYLVTEVLPRVQKKHLATRVDIFIEKGFFSVDQAKPYLVRAQQMGFDILIHADQLSLSGGADLAVELGARSADHLLQISAAQIQRLAPSSVTCVLLPTSDLYMKKNYPPARALLDAGARVALATDFNPGSSPSQDLALTGLLARLEMKMTLPEVISAYTVGAAHALGLESTCGSIEIGKSADFVSTKASWSDLFYSVGDMHREMSFASGDLVRC